MTPRLAPRAGSPRRPHCSAATAVAGVAGVTCCYAWDLDTYPCPELAERVKVWKQALTLDDRRQAIFAVQERFDTEASLIALYYPDEHWARRRATYDGLVESSAYGIVHKWSLVPRDVGRQANAIVESG